MTTTDIATVSAAVSLLTQIIKRALPGESKGPYIAPLVALLCIVVWYLSQDTMPGRREGWSVLSDWIVVTAMAMGLYSAAKLATTSRPALKLARKLASPTTRRLRLRHRTADGVTPHG